MAKKKKLPLVAICGRPNVGKSTLFNRIIGRGHAIVHFEEGITRDRSYGKAEWNGKHFRVVDTGGVVEKPTDNLTKKMMEQVRSALEEADAVIFLIDGQQEFTRTDQELREVLFKLKKRVFLAVNKLDNHNLRMNVSEFYTVGFGEPYAISSGHGIGVEQLMDAVAEVIPESKELTEEEERQETMTKVAIIGRPNVGKSSFINAVLNEERSIVTDIPGTTRDAVNIEFRWKDKEYLFIDTAGMRKKAGIKTDVERFSVSRALRTINFADVCLVMIDATEGLGEQDKRILNFVMESGTAMVLVWTKWDLVEERGDHFKTIADQLDLKIPFLKYVPMTTISNLTRQRVFKTFEYIDQVADEANKRIQTADLNKLMVGLQGQPQAHHHGKQAKVLYATQVSVKPTKFLLFVNQTRLFHFSYIRYLENQLREAYGFAGVPIQIELREGKPKE